MLDVTAVLLSWQRPYHLPRIVRHLQRHEWIRQIVLVDNACMPKDEWKGHDLPKSVEVFRSGVNLCTYGRHVGAQFARCPVVYFQDDDALTHNLTEVYRAFCDDTNRIAAALADSHYRAEANKTPWIQLGWGSFHLREWFGDTNRMDEHGEPIPDYGVIQPYVDRYGIDELLRRKFDRIYTALHGRHTPIVGNVERLKDPATARDSDRDAASLWLKPDHKKLTEAAMERVKELKCTTS